MLNNVPRYFIFISLELRNKLGKQSGTHRIKNMQNIVIYQSICKTIYLIKLLDVQLIRPSKSK